MSSGPPPVLPRPAATILLLRPGAAGLEVLLQRRAEGMGFMAGAHVFPGGRLDAADSDPDLLCRCDLAPDTAAARLDAEPATALGLHVAALRELFEEAGVLLAAGPHGLVSAHQAPYPELRRALHARKLPFLEILARHELVLRASELRYFARWITPVVEQRRFDARFFLISAPADALPTHDELEATESRWLAPREALELACSGALLLPPPTMKSLELLAPFASPAEALAWAERHTPVTVCPEFELLDGAFDILLPGDPGSSLREPAYPGPTRYRLHDGYWAPV